MHDPLIRELASNGKVKSAATRGPGFPWPGSAPRAGAFSGLQYLTPPLALAAPAVRAAYEEAMGKARARLTLSIAPVGQPIIPGRVEWLRAEMLKTRVAHGYCSRQLAAEACPYANICEQCDNYVTAPEFIPQLQAQLAEVTALRDDAAARGWHTEVARHSRVIASLQAHLHRLKRNQEPDIKVDFHQGRLIEIFFGIITRQAIRRGTFRNVKDLTNAIGRFIDAYNDRCQPFTWTKDADELIAKIRPSKN